MKEPINCACIDGDQLVIISKSTAVTALAAMNDARYAGKYIGLMADDASFVKASFKELELAATQP